MGDGDSEKSPDELALTTRVTVVEWLKVPLVPVMVSVYVPPAVEASVATVMLEVLVAGLGEKPTVTPLGNPLALSVTFPVNPPEGVIVTV